jgi:hypothetical protein
MGVTERAIFGKQATQVKQRTQNPMLLFITITFSLSNDRLVFSSVAF